MLLVGLRVSREAGGAAAPHHSRIDTGNEEVDHLEISHRLPPLPSFFTAVL